MRVLALRCRSAALPPLVALSLMPMASCGESVPERSGILLQNLSVNEQLWRSAGVRSYSMVVTRACSRCTGLVGAPVRVEVIDGVVTTQVNTSTGAAIPAASAGQYPNIEGLFADIRRAITEDVRSMQAIYDRDYGFPERIRIDYDLTNSSDDIAIDVTQFTRS